VVVTVCGWPVEERRQVLACRCNRTVVYVYSTPRVGGAVSTSHERKLQHMTNAMVLGRRATTFHRYHRSVTCILKLNYVHGNTHSRTHECHYTNGRRRMCTRLITTCTSSLPVQALETRQWSLLLLKPAPCNESQLKACLMVPQFIRTNVVSGYSNSN
jgi:hypothetical protein